jgi:hypothetical protein
MSTVNAMIWKLRQRVRRLRRRLGQRPPEPTTEHVGDVLQDVVSVCRQIKRVANRITAMTYDGMNTSALMDAFAKVADGEAATALLLADGYLRSINQTGVEG